MKLRNKIIYWIATLWFCLGMTATGIVQVLRLEAPGQVSPPGRYGFQHLGYPLYFMTIIGAWKLLGVIAVLAPKFPMVKEWAYAGFFFLMTGAVFSHVAVGDNTVGELFPSVLLIVLILVSWYLRPPGRKMAAINP